MIQIIDCEQQSAEWFRAHIGLATASVFKTVMASGKTKDSASITRAQLVAKKAGELITDEPDPSGYRNADMARGNEMEDEARTMYQFLNPQVTLTRVGFIRNDKAGCSPDSLIGDDGMLEIKTTFPHLLIGHRAKKEFPLEHKPQCQGQLWVTGRKWVDLFIYWPKMRPFLIRAWRDEAYIAEIEAAVDKFNTDVAEAVENDRRED